MQKRDLYKKMSKIYRKKMHFDNYAFSLWLFISRLYDMIIFEGISDVFFLAREGNFLKEIYDAYHLMEGERSEAKSHYLFVSRKAVLRAGFADIENEDFLPLRDYHSLSGEKFLDLLGFESEEIKQFESIPDFQNRNSNFLLSQGYDELRNSEKFRELYKEKVAIQRNNLRNYLHREGFHAGEKMAVVDIGWGGTIQNSIQKVMPECKLKGFYFGISWSNRDNIQDEKAGVVFDYRCKKNVFQYDYFFYEALCVASHGTTFGYSCEGIPILKDDSDMKIYEKYAAKIQEKIMEKIKSIHFVIQQDEDCNVELYQQIATVLHGKMLLTRNREDKILRNAMMLQHADNLTEFTPRKSIRRYIVCLINYLELLLIETKALLKLWGMILYGI